MKIKVSLLLLFVSGFATAQMPNIDSLKNVAANSKNIEERGYALSELIFFHLDTDLKKAPAEIKSLIALNKDGKCQRCEAFGYLYSGHYNYRTGSMDAAVKDYQRSAAVAKADRQDYIFIKAKSHIAQTWIESGKGNQADTLLQNVAKLYQNKPKTKGIADVYMLLGDIATSKGYLNTALSYFMKMDQTIDDKNVDAPDYHVITLGCMAGIYYLMGNYPKATSYVDESIAIGEKYNIEGAKTESYITKSKIEIAQDHPEKALPLALKAYQSFKKFGSQQGIADAAAALGEIYLMQKKYAPSMGYLKEAYTFYKETNDEKSLISVLLVMAKNHTQTGDDTAYKAAMDEAKKLLATDTENPDYAEYLRAQIAFEKSKNRFAEAFKLTETLEAVQKKIDAKSDRISFEDFETRYQSEKRGAQIKALSSENEMTEREKKNQRYIFIGVLALVLLAAGFAFLAYRNKIRTAEKLKELNDLKSRFFANISHEFRTPLTLIKSPLQTLQASSPNSQQQEQLSLIDRNADRMLDLVNQLLELSKIDSGHLKLILKKGQPDLFLSSVVEPFAYAAKSQGIGFEYSIGKSGTLHEFDKDILEKITSNLLSNALKYHSGDNPIRFTSVLENDQMVLKITNTVHGLKQDDLSKLFERFYQKNENRNSSGIGLALVKELVELCQGSIQSSLEADALTFTVLLPMPAVNETSKPVRQEVMTDTDESKPILLIVDDNPDIRAVIKTIFAGQYTILEAADGIEGLETAGREVPDMIISDVMMPRMDGFEFAQNIKQNELTSFVPVVMLTAKTSDEAHLEALQHSADAFLTKPFSHDILQSTVSNLLAERQKMRERYSRELVLKPVDIAISSVDEKFIEKLQNVLDLHMANPNFSSEDFAAAVAMSRMQLHRKLKSLLGVSTTEFLRNERLKAAAELLRKRNLQVSEIAYSVGFNDVSYFSKCFRELYGCTPTEFSEKI